MQFNFAIIGGGLTATAMLCQLVNRVAEKAQQSRLNPSEIKIQVYEKQDVFGPGFPHNDRFVLPFHITNMCASDMGILYGAPGDFQDWVTSNADNLRFRFSWFGGISSGPDGAGQECNHYPRAIMGEYLRARFKETLQLAQELGLAVSLYPGAEVVDLRISSDRISLCVKIIGSGDHFECDADRVLLATGHWFEDDHREHFFPSPWPADSLLGGIPEGEKVAVIGTSLSAIEALLTLTSEGEFIRSPTGELVYARPENSRTFCLYSRRGLLPKVRGKMGTRRNKFLNRKNLDRLLSENRGKLTLDSIFKLLNSDLEDAYGHPIDWQEIINPTGHPTELLQGYLDDALNGDGPQGEIIWQTVVHQSFDMVRDIYLNLTMEDRRQFDENYTSVFFTHAATQPSVNAEKLLALMRAGIVKVVKLGENYRLVMDEAGNSFNFIYRDEQGKRKRDTYRYVVNARGQEKSLEKNPSALTRNLLRSGTVLTEEIRSVDQPARLGRHVAAEPAGGSPTYKTGSIWIDPETHLIMQMGPDSNITKSNVIYAVGAMTRGQIIDASMVRGIVQATYRIADDLVHYLTRVITKSA
jgi:uncharacterized NAD(P)/FAD-binding protein YdhS